jgi:hypothetical protein
MSTHYSVRLITSIISVSVIAAAFLFASPVHGQSTLDARMRVENAQTPEKVGVNISSRLFRGESSESPERGSAKLPTSNTLMPTFSPTVTTAAEPTAPSAAATTLGPNLIANPSVETDGGSGVPSGWFKGGYGTNTRSLTYPATPAQDGSKALKAQITAYTSGDAKWFPADVTVTPGRNLPIQRLLDL